jgi:hypothetical protein
LQPHISSTGLIGVIDAGPQRAGGIAHAFSNQRFGI